MIKLKTINIKGKEYVQVNERIRAFRSMEDFKGYTLTSEVIKLDEKECIIKAQIKNPEGRVIAEGMACEKADSTYINKTSYIENCETSAWGRALGNLGIGVDTSIASYEEIKNATNQTDDYLTEDQLHKLRDSLLALDAQEDKFCAFMGYKTLEEIPRSDFDRAMKEIEAKQRKRAGENANT